MVVCNFILEQSRLIPKSDFRNQTRFILVVKSDFDKLFGSRVEWNFPWKLRYAFQIVVLRTFTKSLQGMKHFKIVSIVNSDQTEIILCENAKNHNSFVSHLNMHKSPPPPFLVSINQIMLLLPLLII